MKYFICAINEINGKASDCCNSMVCLGFPADRTERIVPASREQSAVCEKENRELFISVPALFRLKDRSTPHALVLKTAAEAKTVLLTPKIDIDLEIPEESIHRLSGALEGSLKYCRGACFSGENLVLILDTEKLMEDIK